MEMLIDGSDFVTNLSKKLAPPLVMLLSSKAEVQYVALRNINLIILKNETKVFFVKYNDPIYIKLEKLDIITCLTSQSNIAQVDIYFGRFTMVLFSNSVLGFFEVDVDFVRKSVRAIGPCYCNMKVDQSVECCVSTLLDLIQTKVNNMV